MAMLKLTLVPSGKPVLVNPHHIVSVSEGTADEWHEDGFVSGQTPVTMVHLVTGDHVEVKETLQQFEWTFDIKHPHGA